MKRLRQKERDLYKTNFPLHSRLLTELQLNLTIYCIFALSEDCGFCPWTHHNKTVSATVLDAMTQTLFPLSLRFPRCVKTQAGRFSKMISLGKQYRWMDLDREEFYKYIRLLLYMAMVMTASQMTAGRTTCFLCIFHHRLWHGTDTHQQLATFILATLMW